MANREGTALSDEVMRKVCFEGKTIPMGRLDLLLPPPKNTSGVYYKPTGKLPRMERPINIASQVSNLSSVSRTPKETLFSAYLATLADKPDVKMGINPSRYYGRGTSSYTPDLTDEIYETLLNAQVYQRPTFTQEYPPVGYEDILGMATGLPTQRERGQMEKERQIKESTQDRPTAATLTGRQGRPKEVTIDPAPPPIASEGSLFRSIFS